MAESRKIEEAFDRFELALSGFEKMLQLRRQQDMQFHLLTTEAELLRGDRARMASELDQVRSKAGELVTTHKKAVVKIDAAMTRIRTVLHSNSGN